MMIRVRRSVVLLWCAAFVSSALGACGSGLWKAPKGYSFSHALFNEPLPAKRSMTQVAEPAPKKSAEPTVVASTRDKTREGTPVSTTPSEPIVVPEDIAAPPTVEATERQRALLLATVTQLVGMRDAFDGRGYLHHLLEAGDIRLPGIRKKPSIRDVFRALQARKLTYDRNDPAPGDLVFFHNTEDANRDGRQNDWYSLVGVVETVRSGGTITVILPTNGEVVRRSMNLRTPEVRRADSAGGIVNDVLRKKSLTDPPYTQYLAGELYAGFAAVP